jgi:hypothetical protein
VGLCEAVVVGAISDDAHPLDPRNTTASASKPHTLVIPPNGGTQRPAGHESMAHPSWLHLLRAPRTTRRNDDNEEHGCPSIRPRTPLTSSSRRKAGPSALPATKARPINPGSTRFTTEKRIAGMTTTGNTAVPRQAREHAPSRHPAERRDPVPFPQRQDSPSIPARGLVVESDPQNGKKPLDSRFRGNDVGGGSSRVLLHRARARQSTRPHRCVCGAGPMPLNAA